MQIVSYILIYFLLNTLSIVLLDKITRYHEDKSAINGWSLFFIFLFFGIFCFLFLNKIREKRKIEHFKNMIYFYEHFQSHTFQYDVDAQSKVLKMKRYLKIKNVN